MELQRGKGAASQAAGPKEKNKIFLILMRALFIC